MANPEIQQEINELLKRLIRIPSTQSNNEEIHRCARFICSWLTDFGIEYQYIENNGVPSILVLPPGKKNSKVLLMSHFDVVEADDPKQFEPVERDGLLYGRGSIDDKYAVAISMVLFRELLRKQREEGKSSEVNFGLLFTGDEEVGGFNGAGKVVENLDTEFFIALDGGNTRHIVTREKGVIALRLEVKGRAAHAARPWLGRSAFDILIEDYQNIQNLFVEKDEENWHRTMVLANCKVGNGATNVVPELATASLNIRFTEKDDPEQLVADIRSCVESTVIVDGIDPVFDSPPSPYLDLLVDVSDGASVGFEHGASDAKFFSAKGVPGVVWGANGNMSQHTADEHVDIASVYEIYNKLEKFLLKIE